MGRLDGKKAVIVGASKGIGAAAAAMFAGEGAQVFLLARSENRLKAVTGDITAAGGKAGFRKCDIASAAQIREVFGEIDQTLGRIDILMNSAAVIEKGLMNEIDDSLLNRIWETNVLGIFRCCRAAFDLMKDAGGSIINISSLSGVVGAEKFPGMGAYVISKYGLWGLTEILSVEWSRHNIRCNAVSPGGVDTEMFRYTFPGAEPSAVPDDIARVCLFLASDESSAVNGENIIVKGM